MSAKFKGPQWRGGWYSTETQEVLVRVLRRDKCLVLGTMVLVISHTHDTRNLSMGSGLCMVLFILNVQSKFYEKVM